MSNHQAVCDVCGEWFEVGSTGVTGVPRSFTLSRSFADTTAKSYFRVEIRAVDHDICNDCIAQQLPKREPHPEGR